MRTVVYAGRRTQTGRPNKAYSTLTSQLTDITRQTPAQGDVRLILRVYSASSVAASLMFLPLRLQYDSPLHTLRHQSSSSCNRCDFQCGQAVVVTRTTRKFKPETWFVLKIPP